jgi:hypothetical protein
MPATAVSWDNANIQATSRETWMRMVKRNLVFKPIPILAKLVERKQTSLQGGRHKWTVQTANMDSLVQPYGVKEGMDTGSKTLFDTPWSRIKYFQMPVHKTREDVDENAGAQSPVDLVAEMVKAAKAGVRIFLGRAVYGIYNAAAVDTTDAPSTTAASKLPCSLRQILSHTLTYAHVARSTAAQKAVWAGGSITGGYDDQATQYSPSISTFRRCIDAIAPRIEIGLRPANLLVTVGPTIYREWQTQAEAKSSGVRMGSSSMAKYGFTAMTLDDVDIVCDYDLVETTCTNASKWMFMVHVPDFRVRFAPDRRMVMTPWVWQGDRDGGKDEWLARILTAMQMDCFAPGNSIHLSNVQ